MTKVATLTADLNLRSSNFEAGLQRSNAKLGAFNRSTAVFFASNKKGFNEFGNGVDTVVGKFNALKAGIATVVGAAGLTALIKGQITAASAIKDTSERLELATDALQAYQFAAKQLGIDNETLEQGIGKLNAKIADGSLKYRDAEDGLNSIADAVANAKTAQERFNIVNDQFGDKLGKKMLPLLKGGSAGLKELRDEAQRTGNIIKSSTIDAADQLGDTLDALVSTIQKNFSQGFLENIVDQSKNLRDVYTDPEFERGIRALGEAVGLTAKGWIFLAAKIAETTAALFDFFQKLDEGGSLGLDEKFFAWGSKTFDSPENQFKKIQSDRAAQNAAIMQAQMQRGEGRFAPQQQVAAEKKASGLSMTGKTTKQLEDSSKAILDGLRNETALLQVQTSMYGQKASAIERAKKQMEIQNKLAVDGITLSESQQKQIDKYLTTLEQQKQLQEDQERYNQQMKDFTDAVSSSFEDAILNGAKLSDVFNTLARDIQKMLLKKALLEPLFGNGSAGSTGLFTSALSSIGSAIFGPVPTASHATGQARVPYDMNVRVHRNERIVPASENMRGGSGQMVVKVIDRNDSKVTASEPKQTSSGMEVELMVDRAVAKNVNKRGTDTNKALGNFNGRTLVRR